jgi:hypothetical protein
VICFSTSALWDYFFFSGLAVNCYCCWWCCAIPQAPILSLLDPSCIPTLNWPGGIYNIWFILGWPKNWGQWPISIFHMPCCIMGNIPGYLIWLKRLWIMVYTLLHLLFALSQHIIRSQSSSWTIYTSTTTTPTIFTTSPKEEHPNSPLPDPLRNWPCEEFIIAHDQQGNSPPPWTILLDKLSPYPEEWCWIITARSLNWVSPPWRSSQGYTIDSRNYLWKHNYLTRLLTPIQMVLIALSVLHRWLTRDVAILEGLTKTLNPRGSSSRPSRV